MIVKVEKTSTYTVMSNTHLRDRNLSMKAKGLMSIVLSLPDNWEYSIAGLAALSTEKESAVKTALNELKDHGYLVVKKKMPNDTKSGRIEYEYTFYETPEKAKQEQEKQGVEILPLEILSVENQGQLNTNISNTNILNTKELDISPISPTEKPNRFVPPTLDDIKAYCLERNSCVDPNVFYDYFTTGGWKDSEGKPVKNWKQKLITWEKHSTQHRSYGVPSGNIFAKLREQERGNRL